MRGWILSVAVVLSACAQDAAQCMYSDTCPVGAACEQHADCLSLNCESGLCAVGCDRSDDCREGEACIESSTEGSRRCSATCEPTDYFWEPTPETICEAGRVTRCADAVSPEALCDVCGCPSGERCEHYARLTCATSGDCRCVPTVPVGSACTSHANCESENCSGSSDSASRRCQEPAGTPCTEGDGTCVFCNRPVAGGGLTCRQSCDGPTGDGCSTNELCLGNRTTREFACYTRCETSMDCFLWERCTDTSDGLFRYCAPD